MIIRKSAHKRITLRLNNGIGRGFRISPRVNLDDAVVNYVALRLTVKHREHPFSTAELMEAPWMITQSDVLRMTSFHSLEELSRAAWQKTHPKSIRIARCRIAAKRN